VARLTVAGDDLGRPPRHGYDHWFRLFLPSAHEATDFSRVPDRFGMAGMSSSTARACAVVGSMGRGAHGCP
jgi:hypothetical protein